MFKHTVLPTFKLECLDLQMHTLNPQLGHSASNSIFTTDVNLILLSTTILLLLLSAYLFYKLGKLVSIHKKQTKVFFSSVSSFTQTTKNFVQQARQNLGQSLADLEPYRLHNRNLITTLQTLISSRNSYMNSHMSLLRKLLSDIKKDEILLKSVRDAFINSTRLTAARYEIKIQSHVKQAYLDAAKRCKDYNKYTAKSYSESLRGGKLSTFYKKSNYQLILLLSSALSLSIVSTCFALSMHTPTIKYDNISNYGLELTSLLNNKGSYIHPGYNNPLVNAIEVLCPSNVTLNSSNLNQDLQLFHDNMYSIYFDRSKLDYHRLRD
jgi:hypothetical protein